MTLKNNITKKHLKNLLYMEFSNAVNYHIRSNKGQRILQEVSMQNNYYSNSSLDEEDSDICKVENMIQHYKEDYYNESDVYKDVEYNIERDRLLTFVSDDKIDNILIKYQDESNHSVYKKFSNRELANYYCMLNKSSKVQTRDLEDAIVEKEADGTYKAADKSTIKNLMNNLKNDIALNLFNNEIGGVQV